MIIIKTYLKTAVLFKIAFVMFFKFNNLQGNLQTLLLFNINLFQ